MLVCENILQSQGKNSLINIFDKITSGQFPVVHPSCGVYVKLLDVRTGSKARLEYVDVQERQVLFQVEQALVVNDEANPAEVAITIQGVPLPHAGRYEFRLWVDNAFLSATHIQASLP
jgi:hypothetical protein